MRGAQGGTLSWNPRIMPWAEGRCQTAEPPRNPPDLPSFLIAARECVLPFLATLGSARLRGLGPKGNAFARGTMKVPWNKKFWLLVGHLELCVRDKQAREELPQ